MLQKPTTNPLKSQWLYKSFAILVALILISCTSPVASPPPHPVEDTPEPTAENRPENSGETITIPPEPTLAPAPTATTEPLPTPTLEPLLAINGINQEILGQITEWAAKDTEILSNPSHFLVVESGDGYCLEVMRQFPEGSSYGMGDVVCESTNGRGFEVFSKWGVVGYDENGEPQSMPIPEDYDFVMTNANTGEAASVYVSGETIPSWVQTNGNGLYLGVTQPDGAVLFIDNVWYLQQLELEGVQSIFPAVERIERSEDGIAIGYDIDGNPIAQAVDGEAGEPVWEPYEAPEVVREWAYGPDEWVNILEGQPMPPPERTVVHTFESWEVGTIPNDITLFTPDQFADALRRDGIINPEVALFKFESGKAIGPNGSITRIMPAFAVGHGVGDVLVGLPANRRTNQIHYLLMQTFLTDTEGNLVTFVYPKRMLTIQGDGEYTPSTAYTFNEVGSDGLPIFTTLATGGHI